MAFDHLKPKPATRISTAWGSGIVEALNLLYDWLTSGQRDITANSVNAVYGSFSEQVLVKGRPVIKDGDPVTIYDIYDAAKSRIKEAIDESQSTLYLSLLYGKFAGVYMDAYGRVGVAIYDDRVGLARSSDISAVQPRNIAQWGGVALTGRNITADIAKLSQLTFDAASRLQVVTDHLGSPGDAETFTTTPLDANATYYGPSRDFGPSRLSAFGCMGYADAPSAADGVYIQLSLDGINWDYRGATATLSQAGAVSLCQVVTARYARVVWVNGSTAQTVFRLGGRYMVSGSENPPLSPVVCQPDALECVVCGADRTGVGDAFAERRGEMWVVYCPKCYAEKRYGEVADKALWMRSWRSWVARDWDRARMHAPDEWL